MGFKLLRGKETELTFNAVDNHIRLYQPRFEGNVEFCFQFNDDEPISFGSGPNDLHIHITPTPNGNISFTNNNGETFKIFARQINENV
jgi:hypothetical protein